MPRFKKNPRPKGVIDFGSKKTDAKRGYRLRLKKNRCQKVLPKISTFPLFLIFHFERKGLYLSCPGAGAENGFMPRFLIKPRKKS